MKNSPPKQSTSTRRAFLQQSMGGAGALLGLGAFADLWASVPVAGADHEILRNGKLVSVLPFAAEPDLSFHTPVGSGLDARLYSDLSPVTSRSTIMANEKFYVRTGYPDQLDPPNPWVLRCDGLVAKPLTLTRDQLAPWVRDQGIHLLECAGNGRQARFGLISAARWSGVPLGEVLSRLEPRPGAVALRLSGHDNHSQRSTSSTVGCDWIFPLAELEKAGAFLATHMNDQPLPKEHGFPIRLIMPGWYACCSIKWLHHLEWVDSDQDATSQMIEFAGRTHQDGTPKKAADFRPATIEPSALPIRVEQWRLGERWIYRVVGLLWGAPTGGRRLEIRFRPDDAFVTVENQPERASPKTWGLWSHTWSPTPGRYLIQLRLDDPRISTRRLEAGFFLRGVTIPAV